MIRKGDAMGAGGTLHPIRHFIVDLWIQDKDDVFDRSTIANDFRHNRGQSTEWFRAKKNHDFDDDDVDDDDDDNDVDNDDDGESK